MKEKANLKGHVMHEIQIHLVSIPSNCAGNRTPTDEKKKNVLLHGIRKANGSDMDANVIKPMRLNKFDSNHTEMKLKGFDVILNLVKNMENSKQHVSYKRIAVSSDKVPKQL
ncbi:hypothetical protein Trydic_g15239 [Trypoxylus dichotomus]